MRLLFFSMQYSSFTRKTMGYNGGGWVGSILDELIKKTDVDVNVSFLTDFPMEPYSMDGINYYPMYKQSSCLRKFVERMTKTLQKRDDEIVRQCLGIIGKVQPDIIHLFGSESAFGLLATKVKIPVVLHIQGIISPYRLALLPPGMSWREAGKGQKILFWSKRQKRIWAYSAVREQKIFKAIPHFMGRTHWDHILTEVLNPNATYHYVSEILREPFYEYEERHLPEKIKIISTISFFIYKGYDIILKTASILKQHYGNDFEWHVFGNVNQLPGEAVTGFKALDCNVVLRGVVTVEQLKQELLSATLYYHPSYIDNSPNSVCEAQMIGLPVIAQNVGGVSSLIKNEKTGILLPANDAYQSAYWINRLSINKEENISIGKSASIEAYKRHNKALICEQLLACYNEIMK